MKAVISTWSKYNREFPVSGAPDAVEKIVSVSGVERAERIALSEGKDSDLFIVFCAPDADFVSVMAAVELVLKK